MARKLIYGNEILGFTPAVGVITAKGYIPNSKLLLINNATSNLPLFNFSDPETLASCSYDPVTHRTTIDITYNTATVKGAELNALMVAMSSADNLQIYYEKEEVAIEASQTLVDPVSKLRVSNPESLIDTDFEYGIQNTKWETVKLTNNVPTSFSLATVATTGLAVNTAVVASNSNIVTVNTVEEHGLFPGSVIEITGLSDSIYEGTYIVKSTPDENTFTYQLRFNAATNLTLNTIYSLVFPGSFYTGSGINIVEITTNASTASTLSVETLTNHGFSNNTKLYLKKSRATKKFVFDSPSDVYVGIGSTTQKAEIDGATTTNQTVYHSIKPIITDDWIGTHEVNLDISNFNTSSGVISYFSDDQTGTAAISLVETGDAVSFYTPSGNTYPGGITTSRVYYVYNVSYDNSGIGITDTAPTSGVTTVSFNISNTWGSTTAFVPSSTGNVTYGKHRMLISKSGRVDQIRTNDEIWFSKPHGLQLNQRIIAMWQSGSVKSVGRTTGNQSSKNYTYYYVKTIPSTTKITVSTSSGGSKTNINSSTSHYTASASTPVAFFKVQNHPLANSLYLPPKSGFSTAPFVKGSYVFYQVSGGVGFNRLGLTTNTTYLLNPITGYNNWYRLTDPTLTTYAVKGLFIAHPDAGNIYSGIHTFTATYDDPRNSSIRIIKQTLGDFNNNTEIQYDSEVGIGNIGGLVNGAIYRAKTGDANGLNFENAGGTNNRLRVSNTKSSTKVFAAFYTKGKDYFDIYVNNTNVVGYGISTKGMIQLSGFDETQTFASQWLNGLHYVTGVTTATKGTYKNKPRVRVSWPAHKNKNITLSYAKNNAYIVNAVVTGINSFTSSGGIGTHIVTLAADGAADDIYTIQNAIGKEFTLDTSVEIPTVNKNLTGGTIAGNVGVSTNWLKILTHNFADGTSVSYATTGVPIGGLTSGDTYYVRVLDKNFVGLTTSIETALDRSDDENPDLIIFTSAGDAVPHSFTTNSVKGFITGPGTIGLSTTSAVVTGTTSSSNKTKFLTDFSIGDLFRAYKTLPGNNGPGTYFESKIVKINSDSVLKLEDIPDFPSADASYFVPTRFYPISDSRITHRPFDGGVNMSAGLIPNTQVIRQSRRYFRYQSGKGIQCSMAINFNPTYDIDVISVDGVVGISSTCIVKSKFPHGLSAGSVGSSQQVEISKAEGPYAAEYNQAFSISEIVDDYTFKFNVAGTAPPSQPLGFPQYHINNWSDATVKAGMFDDQNGFFFKYDGQNLYAVRRSSTQQLSGTISVETSSNSFEGRDTAFTTQLKNNDRIVLRGQTYKVISVESDTLLHVQPSYRGNTANNVIASIVKDTEIAQSDWNLDVSDGTGVTGYQLDINKIQMIYMDYSWYGAGKIRFGFKDQVGEVKYVHEFIHNNVFTESYFRSGNLPTRYEIETFDNPLISPSLFHWGVSVIMDGRFDNDKAYLFTADSDPLPFTNGGLANYNGTRPVGTTTLNSPIIKAISGTEAGVLNVGEVVESGAVFPSGTKITAIEIDQDSEANKYSSKYQVTVSNAALSGGSKTLNVYSGTSAQLKQYIPLVSIRLAPSVDNGLTGNLGYRDIINRMQLTLKSAGVLTTHDCEAALFLNSQLSDDNFQSSVNPSLSQIYKHAVGDYFEGGTKVYSFRAQGGSVLNSTTGKRGLNASTIELDEIALLGNAILGGDRVYPDGPDVLTIAVKPIDTSQITGSSPMVVSARISWAEAQA